MGNTDTRYFFDTVISLRAIGLFAAAKSAAFDTFVWYRLFNVYFAWVSVSRACVSADRSIDTGSNFLAIASFSSGLQQPTAPATEEIGCPQQFDADVDPIAVDYSCA
jgi:hypothetical protein